MIRTFVDTSGFYAAADRDDRHHVEARTAILGGASWITTDHVMVETWLLLRSRLGWKAAQQFWSAVSSGGAEVVGLSSSDLHRARALSEEWRDQEFSMVDCTSFALIERLGITRALAFDEHFRIFRWGTPRKRRLTLLGEEGR